MKKLGIITLSQSVGLNYKNDLDKVFENLVDIHTFSFDENEFTSTNYIEKLNSMDALLISTQSQYDIIKNLLNKKYHVIIPELTISKKAYNKLRELSILEEALLVNLSLEMCIETISLIYRLGFTKTKFIPIYPSLNQQFPHIKTAITTGEPEYIPNYVEDSYDLGHRMIDENSIINLCISLGLKEVLNSAYMKNYLNKIVSNKTNVDFLLNKSSSIKTQLDGLLNIMDKGVIYVNHINIIESSNGMAAKLLGYSEYDILGKSIEQVIPEFIMPKEDNADILIDYRNRHLSISTKVLFNNENEFDGIYLILEDFQDREKSQNKLRLQLRKKGHIAKYNIDNIIGNNKYILEVKSIIKKISNSNSSVLITGESGTGKEVIAQAIHNLSHLNNQQFVAINCAALNPALLESELFGYESGAFTGASAKGKEGIFELAHGGTLFLDEIGEIPLQTQVKLLRVIQEKEVMRVGGTDLIQVNPRIIAATNKNLEKLMMDGKFRRDLYYRLNVIPINVPPLRKRSDDILLLLNHFMKEYNARYIFSKDCIRYLINYNWDGNIRELINCVEYLNILDKEIVEIEDLPYHMHLNSTEKDTSLKSNIKLTNEQKIVLEIMYKAYLEKKKLGRRTISEKAYDYKYQLSESDVKRILKELEDKDYIIIKRGRGGSTISKKGIELFE